MPERELEVAELVKSALEREASEWPEFLENLCPPDLRTEVESLLTFQSKASGFIETPAAHLAARLVELSTLAPGEQVQQYRIESLIGTGGMGEVYLAEDTELGRKVALKFIKHGFGSHNLLRHFRAEERILAALNHPNIAQLYGAAVTTDGVPYFVMEYVDGALLDKFCDEHSLSLPERLRIFGKVCTAVAYAHQNLIIHRDLKPANIRINTAGEPKLLDFGIAKLFDPQLDTPEQTMTLAGIMTPEYASPEQVRGEAMTTASDVYSLGVVLYHLLTGERPYRTSSNNPQEMARAVTDQEPLRPSTSIPKSWSQTQVRNSKMLRGDLDNIVLMAMRKEPARRYPSVAQFADDIRRYLDRRPVIARKDTFGYRTGKFIARNKLAVAAALLLFLSLGVGIVMTLHEARRAERRFNEVRRLANSLMFEIHDSVEPLQGSTPTRRLIVDRALQYLDSLSSEGGTDGSLQRELATAYEKVGDIQGNPYSENLGDTKGALASYSKATAILESLAKASPTTETNIELAKSYRGLGDINEQKGAIAASLSYYRASLAILARLAAREPTNRALLHELSTAQETLGDALDRTNEQTERLSLYRDSLLVRTQLLSQTPDDLKRRRSVALAHLKIASVPKLDQATAVEHMNEGIRMLEALAAAEPQNARARREVGYAYYAAGRLFTDTHDLIRALEFRRKALAIREQLASDDPKNKQAEFDVATAHGELAEALTNGGQPAEAVPQAEKAVAIMTDLVNTDPGNAVYRRNVGLAFELLAAACYAAGMNDGDPVPERLQRLNKARDAYRQSASTFTQLKANGALMPADREQAAKFLAKADEAASAIEQLTAKQ